MFITQTPIPVKPDWGKPGKKKARIAAGGDDTLFMSSATSIADEYGAHMKGSVCATRGLTQTVR